MKNSDYYNSVATQGTSLQKSQAIEDLLCIIHSNDELMMAIKHSLSNGKNHKTECAKGAVKQIDKIHIRL